MNIRLRTVGLAAVAALSVLALAQDAISLKRVGKVGDVTKFNFKADLNMAGREATYTGVFTEKVTAIDPSGNIAIEATSSDEKVVMDGQETAANRQTVVTTTYKPTGEVVDVKVQGGDGSEGRAAAMQTLYIPEKGVKVGDTWEAEVKPDAKLGTVSMKGTFKAEAAEKVGTYDTIRIKATMKELTGETPWTADETMWVNTKDGTLVKAVGAWKNAPLAKGITLDAKFTLARDDVKS